ncbi:MAG: pilus assembly protein HicB [Bacteroidales bacterium]|nr:pilus assembly protein HicB [Bacteroidales bacterium]
MRTIALIEKDENGFGIFTPDLESTIIGEGKSVEEAKADFMNSYKEVIDSYIENGEAVPEELIDLEFSFKYDVASVFNEFPFINATKLAEYLGISPGLMRHYKAGDTYISEAQAKRIETGLHEFAERLLQVAL